MAIMTREQVCRHLLDSMRKTIEDDLGPDAPEEEKAKALAGLLNAFGAYMFNARMG
jgi:hypothetical protein